jgi:hypothetical protein
MFKQQDLGGKNKNKETMVLKLNLHILQSEYKKKV